MGTSRQLELVKLPNILYRILEAHEMIGAFSPPFGGPCFVTHPLATEEASKSRKLGILAAARVASWQMCGQWV